MPPYVCTVRFNFFILLSEYEKERDGKKKLCKAIIFTFVLVFVFSLNIRGLTSLMVHNAESHKKNKKTNMCIYTYICIKQGQTVQESCTLLDTQSQQIMYKIAQVQPPAVFSQEKHTRFSQNIMASTLIN